MLSRRAFRAGVIGAAFFCAAGAAWGCEAIDDFNGTWTLLRKSYAGKSGLPFLSPGNDTRINMQLLMMDAHPWPIAPLTGEAPVSTSDAGNQPVLFAIDDLGKVLKPTSGPGSGDAATAFAGEDGGTRCASSGDGEAAFAAAVKAEPSLSDAERAFLSDARSRVPTSCDPAGAAFAPPTPPADLKLSASGQDFLAYLSAAGAFYAGDFDAARTRFAALGSAKNAWLGESARYMVGRTLLNKAAAGAFDDLNGVPEPKVKDTDALTAAETELKAYLAAYGQGRYAASARGLLRRVDWLAGDKARLAEEYGWQMAHAGDPQANLGSSDLAQEIDAKYLTAGSEPHDANLLAVVDLMKMRSSGKDKPNFSAAALDAQAADFAGHEALFAYLRAARALYVDSDAQASLKLLEPAASEPPAPSYLAFSRATLRGLAMMASGDYRAAADYWQALLPAATQPWRHEAVELGLAMSWERAGALNRVFAPETRIASESIREILLRQSAGPILLRQAVADPRSTPAERSQARFTLLFKEATRGHYTGFLQDYDPAAIAKDEAGAKPRNSTTFSWAGQGDPYKCPALKAVVADLAKNQKSPHDLLCLGEFVRTQSLDGFDAGAPEPEELGGAKPIFPGEPFSRGEVYERLIADPATPGADKAYALFRAVNCYAPSGQNDCGGKDAPQSERKAWFTLLKSRYDATPWAQELKYYW